MILEEIIAISFPVAPEVPDLRAMGSAEHHAAP